jgi:hypothetical protein
MSAFAACYQAPVSNAQFDGFSAPDTKLSILWSGPSQTAAIGIRSDSLGKKVNGEFNVTSSGWDNNKPSDVRCILAPKVGEMIATIEKGDLKQIQPRGKFIINRNTDDSRDGVLGTMGTAGGKIELKRVSESECRKSLYSRTPNSASNTPNANPPSGESTTTPGN